jgi:polyhydroxyalkanoate synthesis regulator phasin
MPIKGGTAMLEILRKTLLIGAGLASLTREKMESAINDLVRRGELTEKEGRELVDDLFKRSMEMKKDMEARMEKIVEDTLTRWNIPTRKEILELRERVERLEKTSPPVQGKD